MEKIEQQVKGLYLNHNIKECLVKMENKKYINSSAVCGVVFLDENEQDEIEISVVLKRKRPKNGGNKTK